MLMAILQFADFREEGDLGGSVAKTHANSSEWCMPHAAFIRL